MTNYRPDIDGLRAIAVLSVLFFHLDFGVFEGGFLGVDVFFVISGFLITRLIRREVLETGGFNFGNFYIRRVRRLFPALAFTLILTAIAAYIYFSPSHFQRFGGALATSAFSLSNFYFWTESGYFDTSSDLKPLLHTWSLSVEEQFYLVWPVVLVALLGLRRRFLVPGFITAAGLASIVLYLMFVDGSVGILELLIPDIMALFADGPSTVFYLAPFRVFEFAIGALMVWLVRYQPRQGLLLEGLLLLGLVLIFGVMLVGRGGTADGLLSAVFVCIGVALVIFAGQARYAGGLLRQRLMVSVGLVSYSLYLAHWPIIVFYKYVNSSTLTSPEQFALAAASFAAAVVMYRFVERPFRLGRSQSKKLSPPRFAIASASLALVVVASAFPVWASNGWAWRFSGPMPETLKAQLATNRQVFLDYTNASNSIPDSFERDGRRRVLVIGDSQAKDFLNVMALSPRRAELDVAFLRTRAACQAALGVNYKRVEQRFPAEWKKRCADIYRALNDGWSEIEDADLIVFSGSWGQWGARLFAMTVESVRDRNPNVEIIVLGPKKQGVEGIAFAGRFGTLPVGQQLQNYQPYNLGGHAIIEDLLDNTPGVDLYVSLFDILCGVEERQKCLVLEPDGGMIMFDNNHLTPTGAAFFYRELDKANFWQRIAPE